MRETTGKHSAAKPQPKKLQKQPQINTDEHR